MTSRSKWVLGIIIALLAVIVILVVYYIVSGGSKIGASTERTAPELATADHYATAGITDQKLVVNLGPGGALTDVKLYPYTKSSTCNIVGQSVCYEKSSTPLSVTTSVTSPSNDTTVITFDNIPEYTSFDSVTLKDYYAASGYSVPAAPAAGATTKLAILDVTDSQGTHELTSQFKILNTPTAATQTFEVTAEDTVSFCDTSRDIEGNTMTCDAFINFSAIGYENITPVPFAASSYIDGATTTGCAQYNSSNVCLRSVINTTQPGTYRVTNTDYSIKVNSSSAGDDTGTTCNNNGTCDEGEDATCADCVTSSGGDDDTTSDDTSSTSECTSSQVTYNFTPTAWNMKTNNFTSNTATTINDVFSYLGTAAVRTYYYPGSGTTYVENPKLSDIPPGVGYWFLSSTQAPACLSSVTQNTTNSVTIPGSVSMVGNMTSSTKSWGNARITVDGKTYSLVDASNQSPPLVKAVFLNTAGSSTYDAYYASSYTSYISQGGKTMSQLSNVNVAPGNAGWIILNSTLENVVLKFN